LVRDSKLVVAAIERELGNQASLQGLEGRIMDRITEANQDSGYPNKIEVLTLSGTPHERGRQHGEALKDRILHLYERLVAVVSSVQRGQDSPQLRYPEGTLLAYARAHAPATRAYAPDLYEELEGIAEGAAVPFDKVLLLNCVAEVRRLMFTDSAARAVDRAFSPAPPQTGCTCLAVQGQAAMDQQVYVGQGYDIEPFWEPVVFRIQDERARLEQVVVGHPGIIAQFGFNGAGLAFVTGGLLVSDQRPGVPAPVVARKILQQTRLGDALDAIVGAERTIGVSYVVASPFGVVDLETSAAEHDCHYLHDDIFACANHIRSGALRHLQGGLYGMDSFVRKGRMLQLLRAGHGTLDLDSLKAIQADHTDYPFSICRHVVEGTSNAQTRCAVIFRPADRLMWITAGNPCQAPYAEIQI
jgi:isopenicillin-N N-acyltransferase-like protein